MLSPSADVTFSYADAMRIGRAVKAYENRPYRFIPPNADPFGGNASKGRQVAVRIIGYRDSNGMFPCKQVQFDETLFTDNALPTDENTDFFTDYTDNQSGFEFNTWLILDPADIGLEENDSLLINYTLDALVIGETSNKELVCLRSMRVLTNATGTTPNPVPNECTGECVFTFNYSTKAWSKTSSTCSEGCYCDPPNYCPPPALDGECTTSVTVKTQCREFTTEPTQYPDCTGTTTTSTTPNPATTTTTTTLDPATCGIGCKWYKSPASGLWIQIETDTYHCGALCNCVPPPADQANDGCTPVITPCVQPTGTTQPPCGGQCFWRYAISSWELQFNNCTGICQCDTPVGDGTCGDAAVTNCYPPGGGPPSNTTPAPDPTSCYGVCVYQWRDSVDDWVYISRNCPSCTCTAPADTGVDCEIRYVACGPHATTTTTTTTTTTSTTEPPCSRKCYFYVRILSCSPPTFDWAQVITYCDVIAPTSQCNTYSRPMDGPTQAAVSAAINAYYGSCDGAIVDTTGGVLPPGLWGRYQLVFCCDGSDSTTSTTPAPTSTSSV